MARGNYTPDEIRRMSDLDIAFLAHYQNLVEEEKQKFFTDALGIIWHRDDFLKSGEAKPKMVQDKVFLPLSQIIKPEILEGVRKLFGLTDDGKEKAPHVGGGEYIPKKGEQIQSMEHLSKEEFKRMMGR